MAEEQVSLFEIGDAVATLTLDGKQYKLAPLTTGDMVQLQVMMRDRRLQALIDATRKTAVPLPEETRAAALAAVSCTAVTILNVYDDLEAQSYMLFLAMRRGGMSMTYDSVLNSLPAVDRKTLTDVLFYITRLLRPEDSQASERSPDPTDAIGQASCLQSGGTPNSPVSATTSR